MGREQAGGASSRAWGMVARPSGAPGARWPVRHGIRRSAWHVLDHAFEIEDRSGRAPSGWSVGFQDPGALALVIREAVLQLPRQQPPLPEGGEVSRRQ